MKDSPNLSFALAARLKINGCFKIHAISTMSSESTNPLLYLYATPNLLHSEIQTSLIKLNNTNQGWIMHLIEELFCGRPSYEQNVSGLGSKNATHRAPYR